MKRRFILGLTLTGILAFSGVLAVSFVNDKEVKTAQGYEASSLPTTIDLNDTSESNIRSYYSSLNNLSTSERQGTNLLKNLKPILKNGQKYYSYENGTSIWQMYEITDRDWEKSPASSTTYGTYNSQTNKITNYVYGTSNTNGKNNPYLRAIYVNRDVENQVRAWGNHNQDGWGINREHLWPKAEGFDQDGAGGARGDPFHLVAANGYANNKHSNLYYGYVNKSVTYTDCGSTYSNLSGNLKGTSKTVGGSSDVFEPQDCDKGDIARAIFYMVARYNYYSGSDSDGIDSNNPNLILTQSLSDWEKSGYTCTTSNPGKLGILTDLLNWHHADPVDANEIHRNNLLYTNFTNNRNPFVDFPEWVDYIWGTATYNGSTYQSYSSTPTGYATPATDTLNGYNDSNPRVNSVTVSPSSIELNIKDGSAQGTLTASVSVSNAAPQTVTWSVSPSNQGVTVNNGTVTAAADATEGKYTVTATSTFDNTKYGSCDVTVTKSSGGKPADPITASVVIEDYANDNGWSNSTKYTSVSLDSVATASVGVGGNNSGKYYTNGNDWRFYQSENSTIVISVPEDDYELDSVTFTFNTANNGLLKDSDNNTVSSESEVSLSGNEATFSITGTSTGGQIKFTEISVTYHPIVIPVATSITATVSKTFKVGETITKSDILVKDDLDNTITDYEFDDYQFTYADAPSGGAIKEKSFDIEYEQLSTTLKVGVQREAHIATKDVLTRELIGVTSGSYTEWSNKSGETSAKYAGKSAGYYSDKDVSSIQIRSSSNDSGIVSTTSGGIIHKVTVTWNAYTLSGSSRTLNIYGSNTAYTSAADLYSDNTKGTLLGTIVSNSGTSLTVTGNYAFIGIRSNNYAIYLDEVIIEYRDSADNLANYVMFEDTVGQCNTKTDIAVAEFESLSKTERSTFMTSDDYVISTARERFNAWLENQGKSISYSGEDYIVSNEALILNVITATNENHAAIIIVSLIAVVSIAVGGYVIFKKKKEE